MAANQPLPITAFTALTDIAEDEQCQELEEYLSGKGAKFSGEPDGELSERFLPIIQNSHLIFHSTELTHQEIEGFYYTVVSLFHVVSADNARPYMMELLDQLTSSVTKENGTFVLRLLGLTFDQFESTNQLCPIILTRRLEVASKTGLQSLLPLDLNKLEKWVKGWKMSDQEKKSLYMDLWNTYQHSASKSIKTGLLLQLLRCYSSSEASQVAELSRQLVALSIADPHLFLMDHLLNIPPVSALRGENIYQLLVIFVEGKLSEFVDFYNANNDLIEQLGLDYKLCIHKMRLLTLATLATETSQVTFRDLTQQLDLPQDEVEGLIIEAIQLKLLKARINQMTETLVVMSSVHRTFNQPQWSTLKDRLTTLHQKVHSVRINLANIKI